MIIFSHPTYNANIRQAVTALALLPLPQYEIGRHDSLVCPSLFEEFGLVIFDSMSRELPVITTQNTPEPDSIREGKDDFIVPIR